ncbi:SHOCT domain-containing protein [Planococcus salinarum]|uniref:SHOCT domain-containing protein n=1 Tax=Planococcus salinarum TaxID=622695 RepID=UPI000E3DB760|nr:SHOCT domain-containing protein [Planococcus salinarum]TAA71688.1 SHOCT domain-containing protein [Planococcus salinarum]
MWHYGSNWDGNSGMWLGMTLVIIVFLLILALAIWMIVSGSRRNNSDNNPPQSKNRSVETLRERYARGEIGTEEFRERMRELEEDRRG